MKNRSWNGFDIDLDLVPYDGAEGDDGDLSDVDDLLNDILCT